MLTEDENIVEIKFAVQYRLNDARAWLFESKTRPMLLYRRQRLRFVRSSGKCEWIRLWRRSAIK